MSCWWPVLRSSGLSVVLDCEQIICTLCITRGDSINGVMLQYQRISLRYSPNTEAASGRVASDFKPPILTDSRFCVEAHFREPRGITGMHQEETRLFVPDADPGMRFPVLDRISQRYAKDFERFFRPVGR